MISIFSCLDAWKFFFHAWCSVILRECILVSIVLYASLLEHSFWPSFQRLFPGTKFLHKETVGAATVLFSEMLLIWILVVLSPNLLPSVHGFNLFLRFCHRDLFIAVSHVWFSRGLLLCSLISLSRRSPFLCHSCVIWPFKTSFYWSYVTKCFYSAKNLKGGVMV